MSPASHVSVKQSMLQSRTSLWKATLALISSTLLTRDWTLASNVGSGGWCTCICSLSSGGVVLGRPLESVQMPWKVQAKGPLWESRIPGRSAGSAGKLMSL